MITKDKAVDLARATGWLSEQPAAFQDDLLSRCHLRTYREKETLYHVGDPFNGVFGLVSGAIRIEFAAAGGEYKIASVKQPVFWFGQGASLRRGGYSVTVVAANPVAVLYLTHQDFERLIEVSSYCRAFALLTMDHFEQTLQVLGQLLIGDVEQKIALRLALLAERSDQKQPVVVPVTQADLAEMCGLSRPTVQQVLANLEKRGLIKPGYRRIEILDPEKLVSRPDDLPAPLIADTPV